MESGNSTEPQPPPIEVKDVTCAYGSNVILKDVSFEVHPKEIVTIMGGSGCGKTTLLRNLIGLQTPARGDIRFHGRSLMNATEEEAKEIMRTFGIAFQDGALWSDLTVLENVMFPLREFSEYSDGEIEELARLRLSFVGLGGSESRMPSELSGGMRKRAALARALALDPKILFFDEPSAGLDPITSERLDRLIEEIRDSFGASVVIVTHELASIFKISDRAIFLDAAKKTVGAIGSIPELLAMDDYPDLQLFLTRGEGVQPKKTSTTLQT
jgi:phospholipid/cholesterol/gamma-HCH transport system ATP-binding protein